MNIVIGVCGAGLGHSIRQSRIIEELLTRGHRVTGFVYGHSLEYLRKLYPQLALHEVWVPWIYGSTHGCDFHRTASDRDNFTENGVPMNFKAMAKTWDEFGGAPDLVISDYEPTAAQISYLTDAPLVTIDQQSKYLAFDFSPHGDFSAVEEQSRLRFFFPRAEKRFACSFFNTDFPPRPSSNVEIIGPILRSEVLAARIERSSRDSNRIIVYLSSLAATAQSQEELMAVCGEFPDWEFVFSGAVNSSGHCPANVRIYQYDFEAFPAYLASSAAIICTAGHNLLSEAVFLGIPTLAIPLVTFEQHQNAHMIQEMGFGVKVAQVLSANLTLFLDSLDRFQANLADYHEAGSFHDGVPVVIKYLADSYGV